MFIMSRTIKTNLLKVVYMSAKTLLPLIILLLIGCQQVAVSQPGQSPTEQTPESELDRQLKIYKNTLLQGAAEEIRIDAAAELLFSDDPAARDILIETLNQSENPPARAAVCKALSQTRALREPIENKTDFIEPLFHILAGDNIAGAQLAAEAILIFEYNQISRQLERTAGDTELPVQSRLNAVNALRLQPDMRAIFKLINLLDDPENQVALESENALQSLGIPIGKDEKERKQIISELRGKGKDTFFRDLRIRQQGQMRQMETELNLWQGRYLTALDMIYESFADDQQRGQFLTQQLKGPDPVIRLWALKRVAQWRIGTKSKLPEEINPLLIGLISDADSNVRLSDARLLALMVEINSTEKLLEQLQREPDETVATELFVALGGACHYAFSPNSKIKIPPDTKKQALDWAVKFLQQQDSRKAQKGADVIRKLLERNGLANGDVDRYLGLISERYKQLQADDSQLRSELLNAMAGLCAQSVYKNEAAKLYKPLFEEAIKDESPLLRESAINGLIYIDKARALDVFREILINDQSEIVQNKLIELAGEVGGQKDLVWLAEKLSAPNYSQQAGTAMLKIFKQPQIEISTLQQWMDNFEDPNSNIELSDGQQISFLETTQRKAQTAEDKQLLREVLDKLADIYARAGEFEQGAESLGLLREMAEDPNQKQAILIRLLDVYLKWPNAESVRDLVHNRLLEGDMEPNDIIVSSIDSYFLEGADANSILMELKEIKIEDRPMWQKQIQRWQQQLIQIRQPRQPEPNEPNQPAEEDETVEDKENKAQPVENKQ